MVYETHYMSDQTRLSTELSREEIRNHLKQGSGLLWIDISEPGRDEEQLLSEIFGFHEVHVREAMETAIHPPKIQGLDRYVYLIVHGIDYETESDLVETAEMNLFLGRNYLITVHTLPLYTIEDIRTRISDTGYLMRRGADFLAYSVLDGLVTNIAPTLDRMRAVADEVEDSAIGNPVQPTLQAILQLKRSAMRLNRALAPQREVILRLSRREFDVISGDAELFYRDVYDHTSRVDESISVVRERADNALALYLSAISVRQNETMKVLAILAAVFLPLSLLAGIYGMNFHYMPDLQFRWGYFVVLGTMAFFALATTYWLWGREFINVRKLRAAQQNLFAISREQLREHSGSLVNSTVSSTVGRLPHRNR